MPSGIIEVQNHSLGGYFPKSAFALYSGKFESTIAYFVLIVTGCSNNATSNS